MHELLVPIVDDFIPDGAGTATAWQQIPWNAFHACHGADLETAYASRFKVAYSSEALYVLFDCADQRLSCSALGDFDDLFNEDVVEFFLWPDQSQRSYFEYEASPLGAELAVLINHNGDELMGWRPWHYEGDRRCIIKTKISGGDCKPGAAVSNWHAEIKMPFALLKGLGNNLPQSGDRWRANFYRIDYDQNDPVYWMWSATRFASHGFHDREQFGSLVFA